MNADTIENRLKDHDNRMDVIHGGYLAVFAATYVLLLTHPDKPAARAALHAAMEKCSAHAIAQPYGDDLHLVLNDVRAQLEQALA